jgi:hypothetical protein
MLPVITDTALNALNEAALNIQSELLDRTGDRYDIRDLNGVLARWLESSVEALSKDACELCVTGDRTYASFNRSTFEALLRQVPSINVWVQQADAVQEAKDQAALAIERAA